jgi:hypothetical protein
MLLQQLHLALHPLLRLPPHLQLLQLQPHLPSDVLSRVKPG